MREVEKIVDQCCTGVNDNSVLQNKLSCELAKLLKATVGVAVRDENQPGFEVIRPDYYIPILEFTARGKNFRIWISEAPRVKEIEPFRRTPYQQ